MQHFYTPVLIFTPGTPLAEAIAPAPKSAFVTCDRSSDARLCGVRHALPQARPHLTAHAAPL